MLSPRPRSCRSTPAADQRDLLRPVTAGVWHAEQSLRLGPVQLDHRMTVVQLDDGGLWVHSPVALDPALGAALERLGPVEHLVAPSRFHDLHWEGYFAAYPQARFLCAPGLRLDHPELPFHEELTDAAPAAWAAEIDQCRIQGMPRINEVVFVHRPTRTLIVADLLFNLGCQHSGVSALVYRLLGTYGKAAASRLFRLHIKDWAAFRSSLRQILDWDFDRVIVGHGEIIEIGGRQALEAAYSSSGRGGAGGRFVWG